ncbi:hypothetical protein FRC17_007592 [Serendipita sp. 399]|nr:hypothetical protein FRC17_007592 [Serendipita sp. 399]
MSTSQCRIVLNPDIAGVGIRISLYILSLAGPIVAVFASSNDFFKSVERSLGVTGLALLLTTLISTSQGRIDLFHALCVFHLVGLTGFSIRPSLRHGRSNRVSQLATFALFYIGLLGFCTFIIYLFGTTRRFGANPECNPQIVYVIFGFNVPAVNYEFRWLFISCIIFILVGALIGSILGFIVNVQVDEDMESTEVNYLAFLGDLAGRSYIIAMLELIIRRNDVVADQSNWSFGQILAMMMLIGPIIELTSLFTSRNSDAGGQIRLSEPEADEGRQLIFHIVLSILDLGFNAAAGAAAAATGAHVNGNGSTKEIVRLGALAGVIKSGILNYSLLVSSISSSPVSVAVIFATSTFGMAFIVTLAMAEKTIHMTPDSLLIGALAAGAPLTAGGAIASSTATVGGFLPLNAAFDALAGYTFARVAHNHGFDVCRYQAAAAAGAVFGVLLWIFKLPINCFAQSDTRKAEETGRTSNSYSMTVF